MRALDAAQIDGDLGFQHRVDRLAEIMAQQHIFGGNRRIGFELEDPMAVAALAASRACVAAAMAPSSRRVEPGSDGFEDRIALHVGT